jgi:hypothetical protein
MLRPRAQSIRFPALRALGRVSSTFHVAAVLAQLAATLAAGLLAEAVGLRLTAWLAPLGGLVGAFIVWASPVRAMLVLPERPGDAVTGAPGRLAEAAAAAALAEHDQPVGG